MGASVRGVTVGRATGEINGVYVGSKSPGPLGGSDLPSSVQITSTEIDGPTLSPGSSTLSIPLLLKFQIRGLALGYFHRW
eukprot:CAMPEP_0118712954 /NCGR_PEP_ID=MMETSP0800-20121206/25185_1 /TAXON_ID=210618 ORGANISM="Striatella unipunctata, Strain CCMP2910" /NCGR_SAMPLE_ID=MMETSP0800 /ASSEMBLY_ACC=CAM_ASM_000638 /LENGTH=79 /DNA_ID=CAMNT_0006618227 /DNA_START=247 /DNA_END=483 /DNA_ORIENTATION=-